MLSLNNCTCYRGVKDSGCFLHLPVFIWFWNISQLVKRMKWSPDNPLLKGRNIATDLGYHGKFNQSFLNLSLCKRPSVPLPPPLRGVNGRVSSVGVEMVRSSMGVGKAQGKTKTLTLWLLWSVFYIDVLKVQCGHVLCTLHFYCIGYRCLILPGPVLQRFFPSRMQKAISYMQSTWDIKRVILVGSCFKVSLFRFRGGIMES